MQENNTIEEESLEDAANNFASSKYDKNMTSILDAWKLKESTLWKNENITFKLGAKWQKEKDKVIIDKLIKALNNILSNEPGSVKKSFIEAGKLLQSLKHNKNVT